MLRLTFHSTEMNLQCLFNSSINIVLNWITTEEHLHRECPPWYIISWDIAKEHSKLVCIHSSRCHDEFQIFASCYYLQQMILTLKQQYLNTVKHSTACEFHIYHSWKNCDILFCSLQNKVNLAIRELEEFDGIFKIYIEQFPNLKNGQNACNTFLISENGTITLFCVYKL